MGVQRTSKNQLCANEKSEAILANMHIGSGGRYRATRNSPTLLITVESPLLCKSKGKTSEIVQDMIRVVIDNYQGPTSVRKQRAFLLLPSDGSVGPWQYTNAV
jgi:hypothetical protein